MTDQRRQNEAPRYGEPFHRWQPTVLCATCHAIWVTEGVVPTCCANCGGERPAQDGSPPPVGADAQLTPGGRSEAS